MFYNLIGHFLQTNWHSLEMVCFRTTTFWSTCKLHETVKGKNYFLKAFVILASWIISFYISFPSNYFLCCSKMPKSLVLSQACCTWLLFHSTWSPCEFVFKGVGHWHRQKRIRDWVLMVYEGHTWNMENVSRPLFWVQKLSLDKSII